MVNEPAGAKCWSGALAHGCHNRAGNMENFASDLLGGERIQHGFVKVVSTDTAETLGLLHLKESTGTQEEKVARCKEFCETDVTCSVWQFGANGCWIEHQPGHTKGELAPDSEWTKGMIAGETLEKTCPPYKAPEGLP